MRGRLTGLLVAAVAALAIGAATASAAGTATSVSIKHQSIGFFGYVHSSKGSCEAGRTVKLFKLKGNGYDPANDQLIGTDTAQPNGPDSMYSINTNKKKGDFYAFVPKSGSCKKAFSKVKSL